MVLPLKLEEALKTLSTGLRGLLEIMFHVGLVGDINPLILIAA